MAKTPPKAETASEAVTRIIKEVELYFNYQDADYYMESALAQLAKAAEMQPDNAEIYYWMGYCYGWGLGQQKEAIPFLEKAIALRPDYMEAHSELACLLQDDDPERSHEIFEEIVQKNPTYIGAWQAIISRLKYLKQLNKALEKAEEMLRHNPDNPQAYILAGGAHIASYIFEQSNDAAALPYYDKAVELAPNNAEYYYQRYFVLARLGKHEQALRDLLMQRKLKAKIIIVYYFIDTYTALKQYDKALEECKNWLKWAPTDEYAYRKCSEVYKAMGEYDLALNSLETALKYARKTEKGIKAFFASEKAKIYVLQGNYSQALEWIEKAIKGASYEISRLNFMLEKARIIALTDKEATLKLVEKIEQKYQQELEQYMFYKQKIAEIKNSL